MFMGHINTDWPEYHGFFEQLHEKKPQAPFSAKFIERLSRFRVVKHPPASYDDKLGLKYGYDILKKRYEITNRMSADVIRKIGNARNIRMRWDKRTQRIISNDFDLSIREMFLQKSHFARQDALVPEIELSACGIYENIFHNKSLIEIYLP